MSGHDTKTGAAAPGKVGRQEAPDESTRLTRDTASRVACPACGFANLPESLFCGRCRSSLAIGEDRAPEAPVYHDRREPERRQLTVVFCDMVGSSALTNNARLEDLPVAIRAYQDLCRSAVGRFGGRIVRYFGDGILAVFGYGHENAAERAVLSALDIVDAIGTLRHPGSGMEPIKVRIGIATGLVVVGDLVGNSAAEMDAVLGGTPNLAARMQELATPNSVVIAPTTRALLGERFVYADLGERSLKGYGEPVRVWKVLALRAAGSRFEAASAERASPIVGREEELAWLERSWNAAEQGNGRALLVSGAAGIGKSRLVAALRERLAGSGRALLSYQCSEHYENSALHPVIAQVERAAGIAREDTPQDKAAKLSAWLGPECEIPDAMALLRGLLSVPADERQPLPAMTPQRQKQRTFELLFRLMDVQAADGPLLIVFEDAHWVDPTTREFLELLVERVSSMDALVIITCRPNSPIPFANGLQVEERELPPLAVSEALKLAEHVAGRGLLPAAAIDAVVARTDGVPLFIEELTKLALGSGLPEEGEDRATSSAPPSLIEVPPALHPSLMARLDQLGSAKWVAQVASVIGREFSYELLEAVALASPESMRIRTDGLRYLLDALIRSGLVHAAADDAGLGYAFKHSLLRDIAYYSMLPERSGALHWLIAEALESRFPQTARDAPELVAHHWTEAGRMDRAVAGWLAAGQHASERSAYREAIAHLNKGLDCCSKLADTQAQSDSELALRLALGPALITTEGARAPKVESLYTRALELCEGAAESGMHFTARWGWWRVSMNHNKGRDRADKLLALAENLADPALLLQSHHCQWATLYMLGRHEECCRHTDAGLNLYDRDRDHARAGLYGGHDAKVCALGERALARWMLGYPRESDDLARDALDWSSALSHVGSRVHAMDYSLVLQKFQRRFDAVYREADELANYASDQKLRVFSAKGAFFRGWARALNGDMSSGLAEMQEGIRSEQAADTPHDFTLYYEMLAEVYGRDGQIEKGLEAVRDAFAVAADHGIVFWEAELHRRQGELLLAAGERDGAESCFRDALDCARRQNARSLELRAAVSLVRLRVGNRKLRDATTLLRPVYQMFAPGFDTPDLAEARELLTPRQG